MIRLQNFSYRYPATDGWALEDLSFEVPDGQFVGVVGANGAGKSTLCYALSGFAPHFFLGKAEGQLWLGEIDVLRSSLSELAGNVGLVFQNPFNQISGARFSVREEIAFGLENLGLPQQQISQRVDEVIEELGLQEIAPRSPLELSGGQQQRVAIASILAMQPGLLILDEPTSQLDPHATEDVFESLQRISQGDTTVVLVSHKLDWMAAFAERVLVLDGGKLLMDGPAEEVLADPKLDELGIGRSQYTLAAEAARQRKLVPGSRALPVTLEQGEAFFR